jgi:hypothetical protein
MCCCAAGLMFSDSSQEHSFFIFKNWVVEDECTWECKPCDTASYPRRCESSTVKIMLIFSILCWYMMTEICTQFQHKVVLKLVTYLCQNNSFRLHNPCMSVFLRSVLSPVSYHRCNSELKSCQSWHLAYCHVQYEFIYFFIFSILKSVCLGLIPYQSIKGLIFDIPKNGPYFHTVTG